jgi:hypothetical protein
MTVNISALCRGCVCLFALTEHHAMKAYWGVEVQLHAFLTLALDGGEWSAPRPVHFTPSESAPGRRLGGLQSQSEYGSKKKPSPLSGPKPPTIQSVAQLLSYPGSCVCVCVCVSLVMYK